LLDNSKTIFNGDVYVESIGDIIAKKIIYRKNDNLTRDIKDLFLSIQQLDTQSFHNEIEIVALFEKYVNDANNAPEIIMQTCKSLLL